MNPNTYTVAHTADAGLLTDLPALKTPNTVAVQMENFHLFGHSKDGEQEILQSERGNQYVAGLPERWAIVASAQHNGVAYLLLAEYTLEHQPTGRGQIGSFPSPGTADSPDGKSGPLVNVYLPLQNLLNRVGGQPGDFISDAFNLSLQPARMEVQPDYDGSVNLIINDNGRNPPRLINSRFSVVENGRYTLVDREGDTDSNLYTEANFVDTLRLFQRSRTLTQAQFTGLSEGGRLKGGSYQLFFQYVNQDGNETDVAAWTPVIPVFDGSSMATTRGTLAATTKGIRVALTGVDRSYAAVRVSYVHTGGEAAAEATLAYSLTNDVPITGDSLQLTLTGFEAIESIEVASLSLRAERIETFRDMTQTDNRLVFAGPVETIYNRELLDEFARNVQVHYTDKEIASVGTSDDGPTLGAGQQSPYASFDPTAVDRDGWAGGYINPLNAAYRLGYASGESYAFGIVFRLADGTDSVVFPVHGHDHLIDKLAYGAGTTSDYDSRGWKSTGENIDGVYRFPLPCYGGRSLLFPILTLDGRYVKVMGVSFELPTIGAELLANTLGCYFVRSKRQADRVCQGYATAVVNSLLTAPNAKPFDHIHPDAQFNVKDDRMNINMKCLPAMAGSMETSVRKWDRATKDGQVIGPYVFTFSTNRCVDNYRTAFYSPDVIANPDRYTTQLDGQSLRMSQLANVFFKRVEDYTFTDLKMHSFGVWKPIGFSPRSFGAQNKVRAYFTPAGSFGSNDGRFGSAEKYLVGKHHPSSNVDDGYLVQSNFGAYVGLLGETKLGINSLGSLQSSPGGEGAGTGEHRYNEKQVDQPPLQAGWLCNLYPRYSDTDADAAPTRGARPVSVLREIYNSSSETYFPITPLLSWQQVQSQLDGNNRLACYGGDTYLGVSYHRTQYGLSETDALYPVFADSHLLQVIGICCESDQNPHLRVPELQARPGENVARSFFPYIAQQAASINTLREKAYRAPETDGYNAGYGRTSGHSLQVAAVRGLPFRATEYPNDIGVTTQHVAGSFRNGFRSLVRGARQTYARELGSITGIRAWQSVIGVGFENGFGIVGINERIASGSDSQGPLFFEARQILSPEISVKSKKQGLFSPACLLATDSGLYGLGQQGFWRFDGAFEASSANTVNSLLLPHLARLDNSRGIQLLQREARLEYDASRGDILITVLRNRNAPPGAERAVGIDRYAKPLADQPINTTPDNLNIGGLLGALSKKLLSYQGRYLLLRYNERNQRWMGTASYRAQHHFSLLDTLYSSPIQGLGRQIRPGLFAHRGSSGTFYDQPFEASVSFIVRGDESRSQKMLQNMVITSDYVMPLRLELNAQDAKPTRQLVREGRVLFHNARYNEGYVYLTIANDEDGKNQRGKLIRVQLVYAGSLPVIIEKVDMLLQNSFA